MAGTRNRCALSATVLVLSIFGAGAASAATFNVSSFGDSPDQTPGDCICRAVSTVRCTLRAAIMEANACPSAPSHTIQLDAGTYSLSVTGSGGAEQGDLDITRSMSIVGTGATVIDAQPLVDANGKDRIFDVAYNVTVTLSGLILQNGEVAGDGGLVRNAGQLTLNGCHLVSGYARGYGGGLANLFSGTTAMIGGSVVGGSARWGGAVSNAGSLWIDGASVSANYASDDGGAIHHHGYSLDVVDSDVAGNDGDDGGAVYVSANAGSTTIHSSSFWSNAASERGGAVYAAAPVLLLQPSVFENDAVDGAGIFATDDLDVHHGNFEKNVATGDGGAIYAAGSLQVHDSALVENSAASEGGGIYAANHVDLARLSVEGNSAFAGGGIHAAMGAHGHITHVHASANRADFEGGAMALVTNETLTFTVSKSSLFDNEATYNGAGLGLYGLGGIVVLDSTITSNTVSAYWGAGGAMILGYDPTFQAVFVNTTFAENVNEYGGVTQIRYEGFGSASLVNTIVASPDGSGPLCFGPLTSMGHNVFEVATDCPVNAGLGDQVANPLLDALDSSTGTHDLLPGSPAIDAGDPAACGPLDQLGQPRVGTCDVGAIEAQ